MSNRLTALNLFLKWMVRPVLSKVSPKNPAKLRPWLDKPMEWAFQPPSGIHISEEKLGKPAVHVLRFRNDKTADTTLMYFHGGAYVFGSAQTHRRLVAQICRDAGLDGISVNYRLAPEHPFPAAIDDAYAAYCGALTNGCERIILAGDSAGGGLALTLLGRILANGIQKPVGLVAFSPWTDMTMSGDSMLSNDINESILPPNQIGNARDYYAPNDAENPLASPIFADFNNAPPVLLQVGSGEVLLDDAKRIAAKMQDADVDVNLSIYDDTPHVWIMGHGHLPEADAAMEEVQAFIERITRI